jgi:hypothetical protein
MATAADTTTKLSNLLPTGTFLTFQVIAPLATNNGSCGLTEKVLTAAALAMLAAGCITTCYTDSYKAPNGQVYVGIVTYFGLWLPGFESSDGIDEIDAAKQGESGVGAAQFADGVGAAVRKPKVDIVDHATTCTCTDCTGVYPGSSLVKMKKYKPCWADFLNAMLSVVSFLTLTVFTSPVSTCFYPDIADSLVKTLPLLMALVISFFCSFSPRVRHGIGYSLPTMKMVSEQSSSKPLPIPAAKLVKDIQTQLSQV